MYKVTVKKVFSYDTYVSADNEEEAEMKGLENVNNYDYVNCVCMSVDASVEVVEKEDLTTNKYKNRKPVFDFWWWLK